MHSGEAFEIKCYTYLKQFYRTKKSDFYHEGGMNSAKSDIAVIKNGHVAFFIEAKDTMAQSGQFVLLPDTDTETFIFSPRNHSEPNEMTESILEYMNRSFYKFHTAGTSGEMLDMDTSVFAKWIVNHYQNKNVKYVISYKEGYVIFPIRKFDQYFHISATYRIKKSGSGEPPKRDIEQIQQRIKAMDTSVTFSRNGKKLFARILHPLPLDRFVLGKYTYYFSRQSSHLFEIRRLSNTYHMNVIFSIQLIKSQDVADLEEFLSDIQ